MKQIKLIPFILLSLGFLSSSAQTIQGTILHGSSANSVYISMRPTANLTGSLTDFQFALSIPVSSVAVAPTYTFTPLISGVALGLTAQRVTTEMVGGVNSYVYSLSPAGTGVANATYTSGKVYNVAEVFFSSATVVTTILQLVQLPNGGSIGQSNFFVAFNTKEDATDPTAPFFGTGATNDGKGYNGYSFVPLNNVVLPVKFLGFTATKRDDYAILNWQIENENVLTDRYEVERSVNGVDFAKVSSLAPKNNGNSGNSYDLTDINLSALRSAGIFYYRIKQVDKDGRFTYSAIRSVRITSAGIIIAIYPNPTRDFANLTIDLEQDADASITINDVSGKQVQNIQLQLFKGLNNKKINMGALSAGSYLLKVQTPTEMKTLSVIKVN